MCCSEGRGSDESWQQRALLPTRLCLPLPGNVADADAAASSGLVCPVPVANFYCKCHDDSESLSCSFWKEWGQLEMKMADLLSEPDKQPEILSQLLAVLNSTSIEILWSFILFFMARRTMGSIVSNGTLPASCIHFFDSFSCISLQQRRYSERKD
jgi:hypothetical protein